MEKEEAAEDNTAVQSENGSRLHYDTIVPVIGCTLRHQFLKTSKKKCLEVFFEHNLKYKSLLIHKI